MATVLTETERLPGCAAVLQQLLDVNTSLRRVVFTVNDGQEAGLPAHAVDAITKLGGELVALKNSMPLPPSFGEILDSEARRVQYRKLALWSHTEFAKIIALDADVFVARRIDEMATFPADTFSPNLCSYGCDRRVAGFNSGVMVLAPSAERSAALARYARLRASMAATDEARARDIAAADGVTLRSPFLPSVKTRIRAARQRGRRIPPPLGLHRCSSTPTSPSWPRGLPTSSRSRSRPIRTLAPATTGPGDPSATSRSASERRRRRAAAAAAVHSTS